MRDWRSTLMADGTMTGGFVFYNAPGPNSLGSMPLVIEYELLGLRR